ncbi:unnamed protein product [Heligmosomoides polygyrus]|uniref:PP1-binding domain-containing protein n=1 Tax=Heligmosomoides polygyrus TaxID=6339 RepID=A0A3P7ZQR8_HELPZ|nr:unnamed protein product [Heligmosomoides polygyrus]
MTGLIAPRQPRFSHGERNAAGRLPADNHVSCTQHQPGTAHTRVTEPTAITPVSEQASVKDPNAERNAERYFRCPEEVAFFCKAAAGGPDGGFRRPPNSSPKKKRPRRLLPVLGRPRRAENLYISEIQESQLIGTGLTRNEKSPNSTPADHDVIAQPNVTEWYQTVDKEHTMTTHDAFRVKLRALPTMENCSPGRKHRVKRCLFGKPDSEEVPAVYKPTSAGRRKTKKVIEFDPSVPSVSSSEELKSEPGSVPRRPRTRSCTKQQSSNGSESPRSWKQAKLTNYLKVRKRRSIEQRTPKDAATPLKSLESVAPSSPFSMWELSIFQVRHYLKVRKRRSIEQRTPKDAATPLKSLESVAPSSPFRFVADGESRRAIDDEGSPRSSSSSPPKSPRKRPAQKLPPSSPRLPKLRSHAVANH